MAASRRSALDDLFFPVCTLADPHSVQGADAAESGTGVADEVAQGQEALPHPAGSRLSRNRRSDCNALLLSAPLAPVQGALWRRLAGAIGVPGRQRGDRAVRAQGRQQAQVSALHEQGKPAQRGALIRDDDFTIVAKYGSEFAGLVQYYLLAQDVFRLGHLQWVMETSMLKTLAGKPQHGLGDGSKAQDDDRVSDRAAQSLPGDRPTRPRQETAGRPLRRDPAQTSPHSRPH
ncbi:group II intron reverse transcriptase/maturase [Nonomuraea thailandensis]|uniref:group II intron reverse transcriptase/maturase n=1 Tax=Nonomuraea thailandensis TaxID=1188745 RepID=UPI00361295BE